MRAEKQFLVKEISDYLSGTDYIYLADFTGITVGGISSLRKDLRGGGAECHIVKNRILKVALRESGYADLDGKCFVGHTAMITGGRDPSGVAKVLFKFAKDNNAKLPIKGGALAKNPLSADEIKTLSELPSLEILRAQLLALFEAPAQRCLTVFNAVPQGVVNVLQAKARG
ncbi:MAG: 50S ribosomal protein L10 [Puniceicoccales bacterium]|jgi:large subunit ribosomal protein L10|nr:50S ribosomal protein L10 [Puniceicoccales bacterium]